MRTRHVFGRIAAGLCTLGIGLTLWSVAPAAQAAPAATYKYTLSKIAFTGSRLAIAATDSHGDLYYFWQKVGSSSWHKKLVAGGGHGKAYTKPSIAWTGSTVMIATLDASGDVVAFTQHSSTWKRKVVAKAAGHRYQAPSIAAVSGGAVLITAGKPGMLTAFELATPGGSWTQQTVGFGNFGSPSIITAYDSLASRYLALITATSGGSLYFWWQFVGTSTWAQETVATAGAGGSYASPSLTATTKELEITAGTTAGAVDTWSQSIGGSGWAEQTVATGSGTRYSHPVIAWTGPVGADSYLVITATSHTGTLAYWWQQVGLTSWNPETVAPAGKHAAYASPAISVTSKSVVITAINTKPGSVYFWYQPFDTTAWHKQLVAAG
ncbi:MAG TPA: hypothetical protein VMA32_07610 [Streptosporangiaceae bacterium]|nr:hypothetical protein [Streptosporangiaceae bacterium]